MYFEQSVPSSPSSFTDGSYLSENVLEPIKWEQHMSRQLKRPWSLIMNRKDYGSFTMS